MRVIRRQQSIVDILTRGLIGGISCKSCGEPERQERYDDILISHSDKKLALQTAYALQNFSAELTSTEDKRSAPQLVIKHKV